MRKSIWIKTLVKFDQPFSSFFTHNSENLNIVHLLVGRKTETHIESDQPNKWPK